MTKISIHIFTKHSFVTFCMDSFYISDFIFAFDFIAFLKEKLVEITNMNLINILVQKFTVVNYSFVKTLLRTSRTIHKLLTIYLS